MLARGLALLLVPAAAFVACAAPVTDGAASSEVAIATDDATRIEAPTFGRCSLQTGGTDTRAECATVKVPLDWSKPDGRHIPFFVKRLRGSGSGAHKQVWLLEGGPGAAGDGMDTMAAALGADPSLDVYIPDHRGTGRSAFLECPSQNNVASFDAGACGKELQQIWGDDLENFSTTAAARDVGAVIEKVRGPGQEVHIYGVSYGTYLAQRYLQLYPTQATSVTLDSICQSGLCSLLEYDYWTDQAGKRVLRACAEDSFCSGKLGTDPAAKIRAAYAAADAGSCAGIAGIDGTHLRQFFATLVISFDFRVIVPAMVHRILRCSADDVAALEFESKGFGLTAATPARDSGVPGDRNQLFSSALALHIAFSEMQQTPPLTRDQLKQKMSDAVFSAFDDHLYTQYDAWPKYEHDGFVGKYPSTDVSMLLMNGTLDGVTPIELYNQIRPHYTREHQIAVTIPNGTHGLAFTGSPTTTNGEPCGRTLWKNFMKSPTDDLDKSCLQAVRPIGFEGNPQLAGYVFGTSDMYEGAPSAAAKQAASEQKASFDERLRLAKRNAFWFW